MTTLETIIVVLAVGALAVFVIVARIAWNIWKSNGGNPWGLT
jgi:hypothetical protein